MEMQMRRLVIFSDSVSYSLDRNVNISKETVFHEDQYFVQT